MYPIRSSYLTPPQTKPLHSLGASVTGLQAQYYNNTNFSGKPVLEKIDPAVDMVWFEYAPDPSVPFQFSARWTGVLTPDVSVDGLIGFSLAGDNARYISFKRSILPLSNLNAQLASGFSLMAFWY